MSFLYPWWALLAFLPPAVVLCHRWLKKPSWAYDFSQVSTNSGKGRWEWLFLFLRLGVMACILVSLMGPSQKIPPESSPQQGQSFVLVLDRSGSMVVEIQDQGHWITRFDGVKTALKDFLTDRPHDEVALIGFAGFASTHSPLTTNHKILHSFLDALRVVTRQDEDGTALGDALSLAVSRLVQARGDRGGHIILLTDGNQNRGQMSPLEGAELAKKHGIPVYTVGLGEQGYFPQDRGAGVQRIPVPGDLDDQVLLEVANLTGGKYFRTKDAQALRKSFQDIQNLTSKAIENEGQVLFEADYLAWSLLAALFLLLETMGGLWPVRRLNP